MQKGKQRGKQMHHCKDLFIRSVTAIGRNGISKELAGRVST